MQTNLSNFDKKKKTAAKKPPAKAPAKKTAAKAPAKKVPVKKPKEIKKKYDRAKGERSPKIPAKDRVGIGAYPVEYKSETHHKGVIIRAGSERHEGYTESWQAYVYPGAAKKSRK